MNRFKTSFGILFLFALLSLAPILYADPVDLHASHSIQGLNLRWVDAVYLTWFDQVSDDRWIATIGLQVSSHKRPDSSIEFPDEETTNRPLGTCLLLVLLNHSGQIIMRAQRLIPGAEFIGVHYARVRTLNPNAADDQCAYIVTPDFQRFYCFNPFLELLHRFRLPSRTLGFDIYPDLKGNPSLLVIQKRREGWLHLINPKTGKRIRSWLTTREIINNLPKKLDSSQRKAIQTFLDHPDVDVMESPNVAWVIQPPFITLIAARKVNFFMVVNDHTLQKLKIFDIPIKPPPIKILYGPFSPLNTLSRQLRKNHSPIRYGFSAPLMH